MEKKKIAAARLATNTATRWTGNRLFFMDSLNRTMNISMSIRVSLRTSPHSVPRSDVLRPGGGGDIDFLFTEVLWPASGLTSRPAEIKSAAANALLHADWSISKRIKWREERVGAKRDRTVGTTPKSWLIQWYILEYIIMYTLILY